MITIDHSDSLVAVAVLGEFTLADFREFEELALVKLKFDRPANLLFDLREMADFTVDMAWEEWKFSRQHGGEFRRIAVITNSQWVALTAWLEQLFVASAVRVFDDEAEARQWLGEAA
jgi:hypothetical protein